MHASLDLRQAAPDDAGVVFRFICDLADYEQLRHEVQATEPDIRRALEQGYAEALLAYAEGQAVGFALYFHTFSTFLGKPGLYLEDLYVRPQDRGKGVGKALLARVASIAVERGCGRLEWAVLTWNAPSIAFYESLGAVALDDWKTYRLSGDSLAELGRPRR